MVKRTRRKDGTVQVACVLPDAGVPVSVVADANDWNPYAHPLRRRANGTRSVSMTLPAGTRVRFRYLDAGGRFFDDPDGDALEPNGYGGTHKVVVA